ncbi:MAG: mechanosensitive ion channel [Acidobacteria bacterium]|nr:mechanosensitive ion channel [Acidobacteriota bacterium]
MEISQPLTEWLQKHTGIEAITSGKLLASFLIIVGFAAIRWIVLAVAFRRWVDIKIRYRWKKTSLYFTVIIATILVARIWLEGVGSLVTYFGILSAGLAIALKELVANFVGWIFIIWRHPFEVGDRVQIGDMAGDVIDLRIFQFTLLEIGNWVDADQSTGRIVHVNNGRIFSDNPANYSKGFQHIWNEIPVLVTFESNWRKAKKLLMDIANKHGEEMSQAAADRLLKAARRFMIFYTTLTPTVYTSVQDCGVLLTIRHLCDPRKRRGTTQNIWEDILQAFSTEDDIDFAYPTQRFYDNTVEGKPGARADNISTSKTDIWPAFFTRAHSPGRNLRQKDRMSWPSHQYDALNPRISLVLYQRC